MMPETTPPLIPAKKLILIVKAHIGYQIVPRGCFRSSLGLGAKRTGEQALSSGVTCVNFKLRLQINMDIEKQADERSFLPGYPSLAAFIASDPDGTTAIFKRFNRLAARHLLHLQSQLAELQAEQDALDREDALGSLEVKQHSRNWADFTKAAAYDPRQKRRKELCDEIGLVLKSYREALLSESQLASLPSPTKRTLEAFRYRFFNCGAGTPYPTLGGHSRALFNEIDDLVVLKVEDRDRLTAFLQDHCLRLFSVGKDQDGIVYASDHRIAQTVTLLSTFNAAALLVGAIVMLYAISSEKIKLGVIALFTALFAANVGILTNARRAELFAATAGYVAVLVVFVSGSIAPFNDLEQPDWHLMLMEQRRTGPIFSVIGPHIPQRSSCNCGSQTLERYLPFLGYVAKHDFDDELQNPTPRTALDGWFEKKSGAQRNMLMATMIGAFVTVVIGILGLGVGGIQVWLAYQQWKHPVRDEAVTCVSKPG
ncbi:hypothetical protein OPT61_g9625 [Boeremia exigua]|uniref:Uncharacterized protein n=1 Tax=Boeremia exigua TaxID=749465 RepID=A0ACC2HTK3_9PLEO|nr:hypothetical protein OPT61_g9625 [Boeremia exigua]